MSDVSVRYYGLIICLPGFFTPKFLWQNEAAAPNENYEQIEKELPEKYKGSSFY